MVPTRRLALFPLCLLAALLPCVGDNVARGEFIPSSPGYRVRMLFRDSELGSAKGWASEFDLQQESFGTPAQNGQGVEVVPSPAQRWHGSHWLSDLDGPQRGGLSGTGSQHSEWTSGQYALLLHTMSPPSEATAFLMLKHPRWQPLWLVSGLFRPPRV